MFVALGLERSVYFSLRMMRLRMRYPLVAKYNIFLHPHVIIEFSVIFIFQFMTVFSVLPFPYYLFSVFFVFLNLMRRRVRRRDRT